MFGAPMIFIHREPQSIRSMLVEQVFRRAGVSLGPNASRPRFIVRQYTKSLLSPDPPRGIRARLDVRSFSVEQSRVHILIPRIDGCEHCILYLHGGSYVATFTRQHWNFLGKIAEKTKSVIIAPDYPLAPDASLVGGLPSALCTLETHGRVPAMCIHYTDGRFGREAGLVLGFVQTLRDAHLAMPASVIMLSPWLDVTLENPQIEVLSPADPFLNVEALRVAGKAWAGRSNPRRMEISPIYGHFEDLPPLSLFIGTKDLLLADCRKFRDICVVTGAKLDYYEYEGMLHVWMLLPIRESGYAVEQIMGIVATQAQCIDIGSVLEFARGRLKDENNAGSA